jgi:cation:H+ antiporter
MSVVAVVAGLVLLVAGAEALVRGASKLAAALGISPLVIGLTVVAFGTSTPELAVGAQAALDGQTDLAMGNVTGSNQFNVLAVLGVSALISTLLVRQKLVRRELPLVVLVSAVVFLFALGGEIARWEGALLMVGLVVYTVWAIMVERRGGEPAEVEGEYAVEVATGRSLHWSVNVGFVLLGLFLLVMGSRWLVTGAVDIATGLGMSELLVGVTIVAIGTSLPELATSVVAAVRGEGDIAVGNVVGSNLFNLLGVLGLSALLSPIGVPASDQALNFQLPGLIVVSLLALGIFRTRMAIHRWEGAALVVLYGVYLAYSVVEATGSASLTVVQVIAAVSVVAVGVAVLVTARRERDELGASPATPTSEP